MMTQSGRTPLVGREREMRSLIDRLDAVGRGVLGRQYANWIGFRALVYLGRSDEALTRQKEMAERTGARDSKWYLPHLALRFAHLGQWPDAQRALDHYVADAVLDWAPTWPLVLLLETAVLLNDRGTTAKLAHRLGGLADDATADWALTTIARHLGAAAALLGDVAAARRYSHQALDVATSIRFRPEVALARLQLAELLGREPGERPLALAQLDSAIPELQEMKMRPALVRALALRDRLTSGRSNALAYPDGLSAREVEVLRLIAGGKSNPEIAEALVISLNTVLHHVSHILDKTGAANRTEAAAYAVRHGLTTS